MMSSRTIEQTRNIDLTASTTKKVRSFSYEASLNIEEILSFYAKRVIDITLASMMLVAFAPLMLIVAILIKLDSPGSALFIQKRVGSKRTLRRGLLSCEQAAFGCYKFRTMKQNADSAVHQAHIKAFISGQLEASNDDKAKFKLNRDPRITRLGNFLRKTSLDELPQLINVIKGEMSLVGPRPVPTYEVAEYDVWHRERLAALPGITGLWQVEGRSQVSFDDMVRMDIRYIRNQSVFYDFKLLFLTLFAVLASKGAK
jgi:lipopolysaccharide/colanic/teichoic acid biosynthesis glycosyltransferase